MFEFSYYNSQDYITYVNLNKESNLINIYAYNLNQRKSENIRKIETKISKYYCFSRIH